VKLKVKITKGKPHGYTTVGWWGWSKPKNEGTLLIEVARLPDWRFTAAVFGHEFLEALYCWFMGITTETCDAYDERAEKEFADGTRDVHDEPGFCRDCPYRWGHVVGAVWEYICIYGTFASWTEYEKSCNEVMGI